MEYPFKFEELLLTTGVLDALGFSEYWGECGDFGRRTLRFSETSHFILYEIDEKVDDADGYGLGPKRFSALHYTTKDFHTVYFLHELYESIASTMPDIDVELFILLTKKDGINMWPALSSYLTYKNR